MKLSEIAYQCQINPPRNSFSWKRLTMILTSKIWKGDQKAISGIAKSYTRSELKILVSTIQSFDKIQLKEFQEELFKINVQVLKSRMNIKIYENDTTIGKLFESKEGKFEEAYDKMDKWLPEDEEIQNEYYELLSDKDLDGLEEFLDNYADDGILSNRFKISGNYKKLAKYILNQQN